MKMKIRFHRTNMKVLVTRISGAFQVYSDAEKRWTDALTQGSFKCPSLNYNKILQSLTIIDEIERTNDLQFLPYLIINANGEKKIRYHIYQRAIWIVFEVEDGVIRNIWLEYLVRDNPICVVRK